MRGASTEIRQQLRNQSLDDLLIDSIQTVGGRIFPDDLAVIDMDAFLQVINTWQRTHVPTYGQVMPNTGLIAEGIADGGGIAPLNNQVIEIVAVDLANSGGAPIEGTISIGDLALVNFAIAPNGGVTSNELAIAPLTLSNGLSLKFTVTNGTESDFSAKVAYQYRCK